MVEGKVEIFLSHKEPEYRDNILWLRPYLDREGYELLYYGANGWTRFVPCHPEPPVILGPPPIHEELTKPEIVEDAPLLSIGPSPIGDIEGGIYEITPAMSAPEIKTSCGCPN